MSDKIKIRVLSAEDASAFWQLRLRALKEEPESFGASYEESMNTSTEEVLVRLKTTDERFVLGVFNPQLVGMIGFYRRTGMKVKHKGNIWGMYVATEGRGQGLGRALMAEAIARASKIEGLSYVTLSVVTTNEAAIRLYESLGFETYGTEIDALRVGDLLLDEHLMSLALPANGSIPVN